MEFNIILVLSIFYIHYIFDFVLQTDRIATTKSKNISALLIHVGIYSVGLFSIYLIFKIEFFWVILNGLLHFVTDFFTLKMNASLLKKSRHLFWCGVGFDQMLHYFSLFITLYFFS